MKKALVLLPFILSFGAPAAADEQLARSLGVEPGKYTLNELLQIHAEDNQGDRIARMKFIDRYGGSHSSVARAVDEATVIVAPRN